MADGEEIAAASTMLLSESELTLLKSRANAGDCAASVRLGDHYGFVVLDRGEETRWLRIAAARCEYAQPKMSLVYALMATGQGVAVVGSEIEALIEQMRHLDPAMAEIARVEYAHFARGHPDGEENSVHP